MTFLTLPPTRDEALRVKLHRIVFTLMEDSGGMYACVVPPTALSPGLAAIYYPDPSGSQLANIRSEECLRGPPEEWDELIESGLPLSHANVQQTVDHIFTLYPFLRGYAEVSRTACRTVFNAGVRGSHGGLDRRVREIPNVGAHITTDECVTAWTSPKWTNAELVALQAVEHVLERISCRSLPKIRGGFGPTRLNISHSEILQRISFCDGKMRRSDASHYAKCAGFPEQVVASKDAVWWE
jgi:hypothetical protein